MTQLTVSAPGKLLLMGDHAVVYERPCLVTAVDHRMRATVELIGKPELHIEAPDVKVTGYKKSFKKLGDGEIPKGAKFIEIAVKNYASKYPLKTGIKVTTQSEFSSLFGFGSSSASTVCVIKALSELTGNKLTNEAIFEVAYKTVLDIQGVGSGFDVAAAIYGGVLHFVGGGKQIKQIEVKQLPLIVGYSGVKADTATLVRMVREQMKLYPSLYTSLFDVSTKLVKESSKALIEGDFTKLGSFMDINEGLLSAYGVETSKLANMIYAIRAAGAYGAKLSGAGGGDCIIAVAPDAKKEAVEQAITDTGGKVLNVKTNTEGVRIES